MRREHETIFLNALEENKQKLYRICSIYSKNREDARDLLQEVLVHIWRSMSSFKGNASIHTWMFRIALNVCLRFQSKNTKNQHKFIRLDSMVIANISSEEISKDNEERLFKLRHCLKKLNESDKAIIALYLEEIAYREISIILGISENNVAVKIRRIKKKLLNCINELP